MDHAKSLVVYWHSKEYSATTIKEKLDAHLASEAPSYSTITNWLCALARGDDIQTRRFSPGRAPHFENDALILDCLHMYPFSSVRSISTHTKIPQTTVYRTLLRLNFTVKHLKWVPHTLTEAQKRKRVEISQELLWILSTAKRRGWAKFLTGDESWFYLSTDHQLVWLPEGETIPTRAKKMIGAHKALFTIFWSPLGLPVVDVLPKGAKFNSQYMVDTIIPELASAGSRCPRSYAKHHTHIHMDNARPHTSIATKSAMDEKRLKCVPHPPFSPDLAPSDYYLFGRVKGALTGQTFASPEELRHAIIDFVSSIPRDELDRVFVEWERRLKECIANMGEYVD
jgi:histone-lysine N-methyltransferase SETMAR